VGRCAPEPHLRVFKTVETPIMFSICVGRGDLKGVSHMKALARPDTSYAESRLFFSFLKYTPIPQTNHAARGSRRQITSIYELPINSIDKHLIYLSHYGEPCNLAPRTTVAERKPVDLTNRRMITRHRKTFNRIASKITTLHRAIRAEASTTKRKNQRGLRSHI